MSAVFCFSVHSEPSPSALPRVLEVFAHKGYVPDRCHSRLEGRDGQELSIEVQLAGLEPAEAGRLAKRLARIVTVNTVLWSEKKQCVERSSPSSSC